MIKFAPSTWIRKGSLANWLITRAAGDIDVIASERVRLPAQTRHPERDGATLAILDTPGRRKARRLRLRL